MKRILDKIQHGPADRTRKNEANYIKYRKARSNSECAFCRFSTDQPEDIIEQTDLFTVVQNKFQYDIWDAHPVTEHLLLSPNRHVDSIHEFSSQEQDAYMKMLVKYDIKGYTTYARANSDKTKSVAHQHTHLIKLGDKSYRYIYYARKPHILWFR